MSQEFPLYSTFKKLVRDFPVKDTTGVDVLSKKDLSPFDKSRVLYNVGKMGYNITEYIPKLMVQEKLKPKRQFVDRMLELKAFAIQGHVYACNQFVQISEALIKYGTTRNNSLTKRFLQLKKVIDYYVELAALKRKINQFDPFEKITTQATRKQGKKTPGPFYDAQNHGDDMPETTEIRNGRKRKAFNLHCFEKSFSGEKDRYTGDLPYFSSEIEQGDGESFRQKSWITEHKDFIGSQQIKIIRKITIREEWSTCTNS